MNGWMILMFVFCSIDKNEKKKYKRSYGFDLISDE